MNNTLFHTVHQQIKQQNTKTIFEDPCDKKIPFYPDINVYLKIILMVCHCIVWSHIYCLRNIYVMENQRWMQESWHLWNGAPYSNKQLNPAIASYYIEKEFHVKFDKVSKCFTVKVPAIFPA